jgi:glycosyltransferase involved in cell wall biosynthesis
MHLKKETPMPLGSKPLVSIVTPVYNTEKYISEAIESVLAQDYDNWEYVIVNNCSTDRTQEIAQSYAEKDSRIRIHNNDRFLDLMDNWNHAMRLISLQSKYCKVVHADDWLFPECISQMVQVAEEYPSIGIVSAYRLEERRVNLDGLPYPSPFVPGKTIARWTLLGELSLFGSPSSILMRSDLIRKREKVYSGEHLQADKELCIDLLRESDFGFVHQVLTFTRRHNEAMTTVVRRMNSAKLGNMSILLKYGPSFLCDMEYKKRVAVMLEQHHRFLVKSLLRDRDLKLFLYHKKELTKLGIQLKFRKLIKGIIFESIKFHGSVNGSKNVGLSRVPSAKCQRAQ